MIYKVVEDLKDTAKERKVVTPRSYRNSEFCHSYKAWIKRKTKYHKLKNQDDIFAVIDTIFKNAAEAMLESDGGVVMEGIGYFAFYVSPKKRYSRIEYGYNKICRPFYEIEYRNYMPYLFTDVFAYNKLKGWSMEYAFRSPIKNRYKKKRTFKKLYYKEICHIYKTRYKE